MLAAPVLNLELGSSDAGELPESTTARQAYDGITKGFGVGANAPLLIGVKLDPAAKPDQKQLDQVNQQEQKLKDQQQQQEEQLEAEGVPQSQAQQQVQQQTASQQKKLDQQKKLASSPSTDTRLTDLENAIKKTAGVKSVSPASLDKAGTAGVFTAVPTTAPSDPKTEDLIKHLRSDVIPSATKGNGVTAFVGGQTAGYIDLADRIADKLPQMIAIVVALSCLVLLLAFRSLLLPLKAAVANLLSVAAAYGVVTFVFQEGHGATLIGLEGATPIVSYVPLLMFAILFGLSMDYEVFLLTQIQEHFKESGRPEEGGGRRPGLHRQGDHLGGPDHGLRVLELHPHRRRDHQAVRRRAVGRDRDRRDDRALPVRAGRDGPDGPGGLVAPEARGPGAAEDQRRGRGLLRGAGGQARVVAAGVGECGPSP